MTAAVASVFRTLNAQLLYRQGVINTVLKGPYWLSVYFFKRWIKKARQPLIKTITNYDHDLKIELDLSRTMGASMFWTGFHEFNEMRFLNRYLKPEMTFVDVGANQGEFALFAAKRLPNGQVLAFEPMLLFFQRLNHNVQLNKMRNIRTFKLGLSDRNGEVPIYLNADNQTHHEGLASLFPIDEKNKATEVIALTTLDDVAVHESVVRIDFIKIDVEGSEWAALKGSEQVLKKHRPALMVELNDETAAMASYEVSDMMTWLSALGYEPFQIVKNGLEPLKHRPSFCNAVFLHRNS